MLGSLFIRTKEEKSTLDDCATWLSDILNVKFSASRFSENSGGGRYLFGEVLGLRAKLEMADDQDFSEYQFYLSFKPLSHSAEKLDLHALDGLADILAKYLAELGASIARPTELGKAGAPISYYSPK